MLDHVIYPPEYNPRISAIFALNEIDEGVGGGGVEAAGRRPKLVELFPPEDQVRILSGESKLALGTEYSRVTIGYPMNLVVTECVPGRRLAWSMAVDGDETGSSAFHSWVITPTDDGCHVLSEETQQGPWFLDQLGHEHPGGLYSYHQDWIEALARAAEKKAAEATS